MENWIGGTAKATLGIEMKLNWFAGLLSVDESTLETSWLTQITDT